VIPLERDLEDYLRAMRGDKHIEREVWLRLERSILLTIGELRKMQSKVQEVLPRKGLEAVK